VVVGATLAGGALLVGCSPADLMSAGSKVEPGAFGPFIRFDPDGAVTVLSKHIEFGQGNHAGLAAIVAEELDADWNRVKVVHAPANAKLYANGGMGIQLTGGSSAISNSWEQLRKAGAGARAMFAQAAATKLERPGRPDLGQGRGRRPRQRQERGLRRADRRGGQGDAARKPRR
jgi:isoquinoline 1-oxidoreductase beta subunit